MPDYQGGTRPRPVARRFLPDHSAALQVGARRTSRCISRWRAATLRYAFRARRRRVGRSGNRLQRHGRTTRGKKPSRACLLLVSVGHDLRTPLTTISGYAEAMQEGRIPSDDLDRVARVLGSESDRLRRLVEDLMLLSRIEAPEFSLRTEPVDLAGHLNGASRRSGRAAAARVQPGERDGRRRRRAGRSGSHRPGSGQSSR